MDLGKLDINLYKCISDSIDTDRVIITEEQLGHMSNHHPDAYDQALIELKSTIADPDYIFEDEKHTDTGLVVKSFSVGNENLIIVLKVCTDSQNGELANSIISGWKISEKRLANYLRNKRILYRKEN